jgi:plasmid segregation protein ParM
MARQTVVRKPAARPRDQQPDEADEALPEAPPAPGARVLLALDVGYSNLKLLAGGQGEAPVETVLPAGAGPAAALPLRPGGGSPGQDGLRVEIDGVAWVAGVEPSRLSTLARELHPDYPATAEYRALVHAALLAAGQDHIDLLVTGLPVDQWRDPARCEALRERLTGTHQVTPARRVTVAAVEVMAQPTGAYLDLAANEATMLAESRLLLAESRVLVVDSGFFSVDWALFDEGDLRVANSGTSKAAMSEVLAAAGDLIRRDHGSRIERDLLERAVRNGRDSVPLFGRPVKLAPYLDEAAKQTAPMALTAVRQSLREEQREVDLVLLAGGGATTYDEAARAAFPRALVAVPPEPVLANVRGFWLQANRAAVE